MKKQAKSRKERIRHDLLWKELLTLLLFEALEVFFPALHEAADTEVPPRFVNVELRVPGLYRGQKIADLLAEVTLKGGDVACVLL
ncbi:MAG: hypothetical protein LBR38_03825, partial [Synergistaceae bacterium]|nr:hypothetical protein [Synergistaceae bacterium]